MKARTFLQIRCASRADAKDLALRLQADGYRATRRWCAVTARTDSPEAAGILVGKLQLQPGGALVHDARRRLPFRLTPRTALIVAAYNPR